MHLSVSAGSAVSGALFAVLVLLGFILVTAVWVYTDAKASADRGSPIVSAVGSVELNTPRAWFFSCLVMWETFFPLYLDSRGLA